MVIFGGYLTEKNINGFFIMRVFLGIYIFTFFLVLWVKDKTKE